MLISVFASGAASVVRSTAACVAQVQYACIYHSLFINLTIATATSLLSPQFGVETMMHLTCTNMPVEALDNALAEVRVFCFSSHKQCQQYAHQQHHWRQQQQAHHQQHVLQQQQSCGTAAQASCQACTLPAARTNMPVEALDNVLAEVRAAATAHPQQQYPQQRAIAGTSAGASSS